MIASRLLARSASLVLAGAGLLALAGAPRVAHADEQMTDTVTAEQRAAHVLNRLGFGARPGDIERVERMGINAYIDQQLHPERIDDSACERAIADLDTLRMSSSQLLDSYNNDIRQFVQMQMTQSTAADMKMRYGVEFKPADKPAAGQQMAGAAKPRAPFNFQETASHDATRCVGELQYAKIVRAVLSQRQLNEVLVDFWTNHFNVDVRKNSVRAFKIADDRDVIRAHMWGRFRDLLGASAHSAAMLEYLDNNENSVVRQRSRLETALIGAYVSYKYGLKSNGLISQREGPNENYAREIMELHTLGVDGGYTQQDVQEVARCFTGWTHDLSGNFEFQKNRHDEGQKIVLGHVIAPGGGIVDGEAVLDILASAPATAHHISFELCQRFVADDPPKELVDRVAGVFLDTDGDLRAVVRAILTSPEFSSPKFYRAKIKSPFEYAVSAVRATGGHFTDPWLPIMKKVRMVSEGGAALGYDGGKLSNEKKKTLNWHIHDMGEPLFAYAAPTGYPERSAEWVNSGALIDRLNFAIALTQQDVTDVRIDLDKLLAHTDTDHPQAVLDHLSDALLHGPLSASTRRVLESKALPREGSSKTADVPRLAALLLGSPEFQRR